MLNIATYSTTKKKLKSKWYERKKIDINFAKLQIFEIDFYPKKIDSTRDLIEHYFIL